MLKSTLAKWAVAAMLTVPAVPMFGKTIHHHLAVHRTAHTPLISMSAARRHTLARKTTHHVALSASHRKTLISRRTSTAHKLTHRTASVRHTSASTSSNFKVHVTKMPPTIDGINA